MVLNDRRVTFVTEINRKEKKDKNKVFLKLIITVLVLLAVIALLYLSNTPMIKSKIISYKQDVDFQDAYLTMLEPFITEEDDFRQDLSHEEAKNIVENHENYRGYYINIEINNLSGRRIDCLQVYLSKQYKNIWMYETSLFQRDFEKDSYQEYSGFVYIIVKTSDMTEEEIDQLIRSIGITVSAENGALIPLVKSETIYFEK